MGSLSVCLTKAKKFLDAGDVADVKAAYQDYLDDGVAGSDAAGRAVDAILEQVFAERAAIVAQIEKAGGKAPEAPGVEIKPEIATEPSGQTSLVPEATTGEKIAAESKAKSEKGKTSADDAGPLFNPDAGKQTDLLDLAKSADQRDEMLAGRDIEELRRIANALQAGWRGIDTSEDIIRSIKARNNTSQDRISDLKAAIATAAEPDKKPDTAKPEVSEAPAKEAYTKAGNGKPFLIGSGDILTSKSGRELSPVPSFKRMISDRRTTSAHREINAWLKKEALAEIQVEPAGPRNILGEDSSKKYRSGLVEAIDAAKATQSDQDTLNDIVFGDPMGPTEANLVRRGNSPDALVVVLKGAGFKTIVEARKFVREAGILPEDATNKQIDETVESAVVRAAREIVAEGKTPSATFNRLLELYKAQPNLASRTGTSVANQAYSTPVPLAYVASRLAGVSAAAQVYEPTAGNGALLIEATPESTYANEIDPARAAALKAQGFNVTSKDGAEKPSLSGIDSVIMNPPFGAVHEGKSTKSFTVGDLSTTKIDHAIALHALDAMADDGKAVMIIGGTKAEDVKERTQSYRGLNMKDAKTGKGKDNFYRVLYDRYNVTDHFTVSGDLYTKQGASWPVDVIVIEGRGKSARPLPGTPDGVPALLKTWDEVAEKIPNDAADGRKSDRPARATVVRDEGPNAGDAVRSNANAGVGVEPGVSEEGAKPEGVRKDTAGGQPAGDRGNAERQGDVHPVADRDSGRAARDRAPKRERVKVAEGATQAKYEPVSTSQSVDTLVPAAMADSSRNAMERVEAKFGSLDDFVGSTLGYEMDADGPYFMRDGEKQRPFSAEQIDAIAAAIDNVENGGALIVGDQTGIGKGRIGAALLRYAMKKNLVPVLVTEKMDLYGDMYRDMRDIGIPEMLGREITMLTTDVGKIIPMDEKAVEWKAAAEEAENAGQPVPKREGMFLSGGTKEKKDKDYDRLLAGEKPADVVFTTYSQMQTLGDKIPRRRSVLKSIAPNAIIVMDEVHNAAGQGIVDDSRAKKAAEGGRAEFVRELAQSAKGVLFMSATYAKRPNVMDLYARTDMGKAVEDIKDLPKLIQRGGVPMQQIVASMLAEGGQYLRRERSFDGVEYAVEQADVDENAYNQFVEAVQAIFKFDLSVAEARDEIVEEILASLGAGKKGMDSGVGDASARSTSFSSIMHNIVAQMLLSIKADVAAKRAITALKAGEKPVITLANTNESFYSDAGFAVGDNMDIDFGAMLKRYLSRTLRVTYKEAGADKPKHYQIPVERLPASAQQAYRAVEHMIENGNYESMPISPIDHIRSQIAKAGYSVAEITGRKTMVDYSAKTAKLVNRPKGEAGAAGKRVTISKFNAGTLDAVILNRSGSTGVSMHAKKGFKDLRKRRMILAQAEGNIDTHMQMLGRVHRTGQVVLPAYTQLAAGIPAEVRPTAVLMKKMASLNANTTGARGSTFTAEAVDFMNEVGDKVMATYLWENPEINVALGEPYDGVEHEDLVQKATGKLVLLSIAQQRELLETVQRNYALEIAQLDALGENPLEAKLLDLQAETLESAEIKPKQGNSPFLDSVRMEKVSVKAQGRALPISEIADNISDSLKTIKPEGDEEAVLNQLERKGREWMAGESRRIQDLARRQMAEELAQTKADSAAGVRTRHESALLRWQQTMNVAYPGARVTLAMPSGDLDGIVMSVSRSGKAKSITAASAWTVKIAVPDSARQFEFPMSKLFPPGVAKSEDEKGAQISRSSAFPSMLIQQFEDARKEGREVRYIATGNILGGFDQTGGKGRIINFTTSNGDVRPGILMERGFELEKFMGQRAIRLKSGEQVAKFIDRVSDVDVKGRDAELVTGKNRGGYYVQMAKARGKAGKYYTNATVRAAIAPKEFEAKGNTMLADSLTRAEFVKVIDELRNVGAAFEVDTAQDEALKIVAEDAPAVDAAIGATSLAMIKRGRTLSIPATTRQAVHAALAPAMSVVPSDVNVGTLKKIVPGETMEDGDRAVTLTLERADGSEFTMGFPLSLVDSLRAFRAPGDLISDGRDSFVFLHASASGDVSKTLRGELWHETVHQLRSTGRLSGPVWDRLVRHAKGLRVLDTELSTHLRMIGDPDWKNTGNGSLAESYTKLYRGRKDFAEIMDQEAVAHFVEQASHDQLLPMEIDPVRDILTDIWSGKYSGKGASEQAAREPATMDAALRHGDSLSSEQKIENVRAVDNLIYDMPRERRESLTDKLDVVISRSGAYLHYDLVPKGRPLWKRNGQGSNSVGNFLVKAAQRKVRGVEITNAGLTDAYQRQGLGTKIYDMVDRDFESVGGLSPSPIEQLSDNAKAFWRKRLPDEPAMVDAAIGGYKTEPRKGDRNAHVVMRRLSDRDGKPFLARVVEDGDDITVEMYDDKFPGVAEENISKGTARLGRKLGYVDLNFMGVGHFATHGHRGPLYEVGMVEVEADQRMRGLAKSAYNMIEDMLGTQMMPSGTLLPPGYEHWKRRNPDLVRGHQYHRDDEMYYSPKKIKEDLDSYEKLYRDFNMEEAIARYLKISQESFERTVAAFAKVGVPEDIMRHGTRDELIEALEVPGLKTDELSEDYAYWHGLLAEKKVNLLANSLLGARGQATEVAGAEYLAQNNYARLRNEVKILRGMWRAVPKDLRSERAREAMFSNVSGQGEKTAIDVDTAIKDAIDIVNRIAGPGVDVKAMPRVTWTMDGRKIDAGGTYTKNGDARALISLAYANPSHDIRTTAGHEAYHHVEERLATEGELRLLRSPSEMARAAEHAAAEIGMSIREVRQLPDYEIRAYAFQRYRRLREEGRSMSPLHIGIRRAWDRIIMTLRNIQNALRFKGYDSMESIFERARTGEMVARSADRQVDDAAASRPAARGLRFDRQMVPGGHILGEPFDLSKVREIRRYTASVPLADVRTTQASVGIAAVKDKIRHPSSDDGKRVSLFKWDGLYYVNDGNHRVEAARARGAPAIIAEVIEIAPRGTDGAAVLETGRSADVSAQRVRAQEADQRPAAVLRNLARRAANDDRATASGSDVGAFADQWLKQEDGAAASIVGIYEGYLEWAEQAGVTPVTLPTFTSQIADHGIRRQRIAGKDRFVGFVLRPENERPAASLPDAAPDPIADQNASDVAAEVAKGVSVWEAMRRVYARLMATLGVTPEKASETEARLAHLERLRLAVGNDNRATAAIHGNVVSLPSQMASIFPTVNSPGTFFGRKVAAIMRRITPSQATTDQWRVRVQDRFLMVRRQQEAIERDTGVQLPLNLDVYVAESLYHGRAGERATDLEQQNVEPLVDHLRKYEITGDELGEYLYARHAQERNAYIRSIDPDNDAGSGMTDAESQEILDRVSDGPKAEAFEDAAKMVDAINKKTRDTLLSSGLISREVYDEWETGYQHYVPLRGWEANNEEEVFPRVGKGFNVRGPEAYKALGRRTKSDNPLAYVLLQATQAIVRSEKNRVNKTLMRLVQTHPDPDVWKVYKGEYRRRINEKTGEVETYFVPPQFSAHDPSIVGVKIGGKQHYIQIHNPNLARALRGVGSSDLDHAIVRNMMAITRFYAQLLTSWNPEFVVGNFFRDVQTALLNSKAVQDLPAGARTKMLGEALSMKSIRGIWNALRGDGSKEHAQYFEEYRLAGGKVSFMEYNDIERIKDRINKRVAEGDIKRSLRGVVKYVEDANAAVENGVRLSTYIAMRKAGISKDRAASVARELTVNFNRKGEWGPVINSAYLFFNASVQGSTRMLQALAHPAVRRAVYAIVAGGFALDIINYLIAGDDDDKENAYEKIKPWIKEKNMIFMLPGRKDYIMIPMPYGYNVPYIAGRIMGDLARTAAGHGKLTPAKAASGLMSALQSSFNPLGEGGSFAQMLTPTFVDPILQVSENKTWYGGPIYPVKYDKNKPDSENYFASVHPAFIAMAKALNSATGGNAAKSGTIDISPEVLEHYAQFVGGGIAKFLINASGTATRTLNGEEFVPEKTPLVRRLYGAQTSSSRRSDFYEQWQKVDAAHYEIFQLNKAGDRESIRSAREQNRAELESYSAMKATRDTLAKLSKERAKVQLDRNIGDTDKQARIKEIQDRENAIILRALETYQRAQKKGK